MSATATVKRSTVYVGVRLPVPLYEDLLNEAKTNGKLISETIRQRLVKPTETDTKTHRKLNGKTNGKPFVIPKGKGKCPVCGKRQKDLDHHLKHFPDVAHQDYWKDK